MEFARYSRRWSNGSWNWRAELLWPIGLWVENPVGRDLVKGVDGEACIGLQGPVPKVWSKQE